MKIKKKSAIIIGTAIVVGGLIVWGGIVLFQGKKQEETPRRQGGKDISDVIKNETENKQGDIEFSDITVKSVGSNSVISGKVKNTGSAKERLDLEVRMYDSDAGDGVIITIINDIKTNEEKDFEVDVVNDYFNAKRFEVKVVNLEFE